ncbi:MAG: SHOCT domain-containing protein [Clostridia bacterium]|nr:SHOCT domain-containing protein [Clostridia bacterium]
MASSPVAGTFSALGAIGIVVAIIVGGIVGACMGVAYIEDGTRGIVLGAMLGALAGGIVGGVIMLIMLFLGEIGTNLRKAANNQAVQTSPATRISADEVKKCKELYDDGIITKEEFERIKKQFVQSVQGTPSLQEIERELILLRKQVAEKKRSKL